MKASDYRKTAREGLKGNWGKAVLIQLISSLILGVLLPTGIGTILLAGLLSLGLVIFNLNVLRKQKSDIGDLFAGANQYTNATLTNFVMGIFIFFWALLLIIPAIIKSYSYAMTMYIRKDNPEIGVLDAITESRNMMNGKKWKLFCLNFSFIGWAILSIFTFGIGLLWLLPYMNMSTAAFYENAKKDYHPITISK
jgi:uncharacterized membrane protein